MSLKSAVLLVFIFLLLLCCARGNVPPTGKENVLLPQRNPTIINLAVPWSDAEREYSGASVYDDSVVLMPQYPGRIGNRIPVIPVKHLLASNLQEKEYDPPTVRFDDDGLSGAIGGFEGFEAIAFVGNDVFVTIESHKQTGMMGYLVRGKVIFSNSAFSIKLNAATRVELPPRAGLSNMTDESIVILPDGKLLTFYEANGANVVRNPVAYMFDINDDKLRRLANVPIPNIEYRITDCSPADGNGKFWCINSLYPGDEARLHPGRDAFAERWGIDSSQSDAWKNGKRVVERLVELRFDGTKVVFTENAPIYLKLRNDGISRNWEGLALVAGQGFFLVTDKYPKTIFAFVRQ